MRIHSDTLTPADFYRGLRPRLPEVYVNVTEHGSRKRKNAFELSLSAEPREGRRYRNSGTRGADGDAAAFWDEWGIVLARIFDIDPNATSAYYDGAGHFEWSTGGRFADGGPAEIHPHHRWENGWTLSTSVSHVTRCRCGATRRALTYGQTWQTFQAAHAL